MKDLTSMYSFKQIFTAILKCIVYLIKICYAVDVSFALFLEKCYSVAYSANFYLMPSKYFCHFPFKNM